MDAKVQKQLDAVHHLIDSAHEDLTAHVQAARNAFQGRDIKGHTTALDELAKVGDRFVDKKNQLMKAIAEGAPWNTPTGLPPNPRGTLADQAAASVQSGLDKTAADKAAADQKVADDAAAASRR